MKNAEHIFFITLAVISGIFIDRCPIAAKIPPLYSTTAPHSSSTAASHCNTTTGRSNVETRPSDVPANHGKTTTSHSDMPASPNNDTTGCLSVPGTREAIPFGDFEQWTHGQHPMPSPKSWA